MHPTSKFTVIYSMGVIWKRRNAFQGWYVIHRINVHFMSCGTLHHQSYLGKCLQASVIPPIRDTEPATGKESYCCLQQGSLVNTWREHAGPSFPLLDHVHLRNGSTEFLLSVRPQTKSQRRRTALHSTPSLEPGTQQQCGCSKGRWYGSCEREMWCAVSRKGRHKLPRDWELHSVCPPVTRESDKRLLVTPYDLEVIERKRQRNHMTLIWQGLGMAATNTGALLCTSSSTLYC